MGQTEQQVAAIADLKPSAYTGTPSFLRIILDKADELGVKPSFTKAFVSGEAFAPSQRDALAARGIQAFQAYATAADLGLIAYESGAREGLVVDEGCWSRSCDRAPAIRCRPAKSEKWW